MWNSEENGYLVCRYCGTKHVREQDEKLIKSSSIDLNNDVARLLQKCKEDPARAKKYAERILEMDPNNIEARKLLNSGQGSSSGGCYIATAVYGSYDCPEVWTLRRFRDYKLAENWFGRQFITLYYAISPKLVKWFGKTRWFRGFWKPKLNKMVRNLNNNGVDNTPYQDKSW